MLAAQLVRIVGLLEAARVPTVCYKGPALARAVYYPLRLIRLARGATSRLETARAPRAPSD